MLVVHVTLAEPLEAVARTSAIEASEVPADAVLATSITAAAAATARARTRTVKQAASGVARTRPAALQNYLF
jgi:hypothetical protein